MESIDIVILGAGISGLGAALKAREQNRQAVIFEERKQAGGLLDSFFVDEFCFDHAVHLSFAQETLVRNVFDQTQYYTHPAESLCFEEQRWLKHPVQNNLFPLPPEQKVALIQSFLERPELMSSDNYESWLHHQYGDAIAERFPAKYTRKYWATDPRLLSTSWVGNRMRRADIAEILLGALTDKTPNTYYTKEMRYPVSGGYKSFIKGLINDAKIFTEHSACRIDTSSKTVLFTNGRIVQYQQLISTLPLPVLVSIINAPAEVLKAAEELVCTSIDLISIGISEAKKFPIWFYVYDEDVLASRIYSPSMKSPNNAPVGCSSLQFEFYSRGLKSSFSPEDLVENVKYTLKKLNLCDLNNVLFFDHRRLPYGNVIFDLGMEENRKVVLDYICRQDVASCGRFGEWDYLWSNQSFISGYNALNARN